jgi:uncharacterized protein YggE
MSAGSIRRPLTALFVTLLAVALGSAALRPAAAQTVPGMESGIVATGFGQASAPASSAEVQLIVSRDPSGMYGMYGVVETVPPDSGTVTVEGSPVAGEGESGATSDPMMTDPAMVMPAPLTEADLAPIVDAVVAAGVAEAEITVLAPSTFSSFTGPGGPQTADIRFSVADPAVEDLTALAQSAQQAALDAGLSLMHVGVTYLGDDCATLQQQARTAAVADAQARAEGLAEALGVELGELIQAADGSIFYGPYGGDPTRCVSQLFSDTGYGPGVDPPFDPTHPAEVVIVANVTLTFAMGEDASA